MLVRITGSTPQSRNTSALHVLQRLSSIAFALGYHKERIPDDVSTRGDVDACSRASRATLYLINTSLIIVILYLLAREALLHASTSPRVETSSGIRSS